MMSIFLRRLKREPWMYTEEEYCMDVKRLFDNAMNNLKSAESTQHITSLDLGEIEKVLFEMGLSASKRQVIWTLNTIVSSIITYITIT